KKWLSEKEVVDYYAIGQCTPGIIAVNVSTFTGYKLAGVKGAIAATMGIITPSLIIILALAGIISLFLNNEYVLHAFTGIRVVVTALIADIVLNMSKKNIKDIYQFLIFVGVAVLMLAVSVSPAWIVCGAAVLGLSMRKGKKA
ncbi:MAG: chromate transporter, partial [Alphaproteobacteria bacterium]|nr:chromate transporter [Alphaproteobacteria bacterium]